MSLAANADIFAPGSRALTLARDAWAGRGFFTSVRRQLADGTWLGAADAPDLATLGLIEIPYTFGEPEELRRDRLVEIAQRAGFTTEGTENTEKGRAQIPDPENLSPPVSVASVFSVVPIPVGEPQGLDTITFFADCRMALPGAHVVVDLERLGLKLGQLCLSFGADTLVGTIVNQRELRLGARATSNELTREEAARLLRASGFAPCEGLPGGEVRPL
jgi:hypothetical protein